MYKYLSLCVLAALPLLGVAKDAPKSETEPKLSAANIVKKEVSLPMRGFHVVRTTNGKTLFLSSNGRYRFEGKLINSFTQKEIKSIEDAEDEEYFSIQDLNLSDSDIAPIPFGNPDLPLQARVFIDPFCPTCSQLMDELNKVKKDIRVEILITPVSSKAAIRRGLELWCRYETDTDQANQVLSDLVHPPKEPKATPNPMDNKACHGNRVLLNSMLTSVLAAPGMPYLWRADGKTFAGIPKDIKAFLKEKRTKPEEK